MQGLVIKNTGSWYTVLTDDGQLLDCKVKGNFRIKGIRSTNPVAVGDRVSLSLTLPKGEGMAETDKKSSREALLPLGEVGRGVAWITDIEDRKNYIIRKSINLSKQSHILAANVDQAFLVVTVSKPETSTTFIDRFLASAEAYRVPVFLIFNKSDLLDATDARKQADLLLLYENIGYECRAISAETGEGVEALRPLLKGKITLLSGNSGVGKSTLINRLVPGANLRTADISDAHQMGMHTTTFSEMISLPNPSEGGASDSHSRESSEGASDSSLLEGLGDGGIFSPPLEGLGKAFLIDTPGIKGFGTFDMEREELTSYFREIFEYSKQCRFSDCTHTHEPGCAVLQAVDDHLIAPSRYQSYLSMLDDKDENKYREAY